MKNQNHFLFGFEQLSTDSSAKLDGFVKCVENQTIMFVSGSIFGRTPADILKKYIKDGSNVFRSIDGDFLIIIVDNGKVNIFRDRHGAGQQLYYNEQYCSDMLSSFLSLPNFEVKPNIEALFTFMGIGYIPSPQTSLVGVNKLPGGCLLSFENRKFTVTDLFGPDDFFASAGTSRLSFDEAINEYERLHAESVKARIVNADKIGLLLSGGYDSGGNISKLRDLYPGNVVSFSIGFKDNPWTELPLARLLADKYQSTHYEYEIDGSEILDLPTIIGALGDPFQEGGLMLNYSAMRLVKETGENPDIILGGDGNDQHFGTSGKDLAIHWMLKKKGIQFVQKLYDKAGSLSLLNKDNLLFRAQFQNRKILYVQQNDTFGFTRERLDKLKIKGLHVAGHELRNNNTELYSDFEHFFNSRNYFVDIKQVANEVILHKASKMANLFGNNITFPYMSTDLYNFLKQMPMGYKFYGTFDELLKGKGKSKYLHKKYLEPKLPKEITQRKKQGGFAPLPIFLKNAEQREMLFDFIEESDMVQALFDKGKIHNLLNNYNKLAESKGYWFWYQQVMANQMMNLLTLTVWWEMFVNGKHEAKTIFDLL